MRGARSRRRPSPSHAVTGPASSCSGCGAAREAVWVEVFDPDLRLPRLRSARATDEGGRGLYLVEQLATRWGSRPTPEGKAVWFEIPLDGSLAPPALARVMDQGTVECGVWVAP